jgi:hypothetical protein
MSTNPLRENLNRAKQIKSETGDIKQSITLFDIDYAMMSYLEDTVLPTLDDNGKALKIPVIYGNSERWNGSRRQGVYRDAKGKLQLPLMMIRRNTVSKDETMPFLRRGVYYQTISKYSKDNRYDHFSVLGGAVKPKRELYNILMPEFVEITYECMAWTTYTEQLNQVIEALNFTGQYWGDKDKFKFRTQVTDYNVINEVGDGTERINRVEFNLVTKAYLLPEKFDGESPIKKSMSVKRVVVATEVDVTSGSGRLEGMLTTPSPYYDNKDLIDFLSLNNSRSQNPTTNNTITFSNIKLIKTPSQLSSVVTSGVEIDDILYDLKLYINGVRYYDQTHFTASYSNNSLTFNFNLGLFTQPVDSGDEIAITGKFIDLV